MFFLFSHFFIPKTYRQVLLIMLYFKKNKQNCQEKKMNAKVKTPKIILLVGMMGCGKTSLGKLLAKHLDLPFVDSDKEIEKASGCSISDLFATYGEEQFALGEERIMERLLKGKPCVLSSGGRAFLSEKTRKNSKKTAVSVWIRADVDLLSRRTEGRKHRPLVPAKDNKKAIERLVAECYPFYAEADLTLDTQSEPIRRTVRRLLTLLADKDLIELTDEVK